MNLILIKIKNNLKMDKLPKDVVELITNELTPREFFNYCKSEVGQEFCAKKEIWLRRHSF